MVEKVSSGKFQISRRLLSLVTVILLVTCSLLLVTVPAWAATKASPSPNSSRLQILEKELTTVAPATTSATTSAQKEATASAIVKKVIEKQPDLTQAAPAVQGKLERYLSQQSLTPLSWHNFLKYILRLAVARGVPANTIVLIILFPLVAAWVAFARHVIGLAGFGIFTPAVLAVVFLATGVVSGILLFLGIILAATLARVILKPIRLQYLPRMAFLLWVVSLAVFGLMLLASYVSLPSITMISIFPVLISISLAETFMEVQIKNGMRQASYKTAITVLVAIFGYWFLQLEPLQRFVLLQPEIAVLSVGLFDILVGKYSGLRLTEYKKFRQIM